MLDGLSAIAGYLNEAIFASQAHQEPGELRHAATQRFVTSQAIAYMSLRTCVMLENSNLTLYNASYRVYVNSGFSLSVKSIHSWIHGQ